MGGRRISWTICKSFAPCFRQLEPHHSIFYIWMFFLMPNQLCRSTEGQFNGVKVVMIDTVDSCPWVASERNDICCCKVSSAQFSKTQHKGNNSLSVRSPVVDEEGMRPGHWLGSVLCVGSRPSDHYFHCVCWFVCLSVLFVQSFSQPSLIRFRSNYDIRYMSGSSCVP